MKRPLEPMPKRIRAKSPWPFGVKKKVYEEMTMTNARANGFGHVSPEIKEGEDIFVYQERASRSYGDYTLEHITRLKGMVAIAALVEDRSPDEILRDVRGY